MERRNIEVPRMHGGEAVARIVHDGLGVAHATAKGLIDEGCVTLNGRPVTTHGQRVQVGDVVEVRFDPARQYHPLPTPRHGSGYRVVHEDYEIVVVNKMPGVLSSPSPRVGDESLAERIADSLRARGIKRPKVFVVHRLDRHTSGLLVFAKTQRALESLSAQFESREAGRVYSAIVEGRVDKDRGTIVSYLAEDPKSLSVRTTPLRGAGKRAVTHFEVVERLPAATIVRVRLETGRKHQIRIHFAEIGHPVIGDRRYGSASELIPRVALHAERLTIKHPKTLERVTYEAPWPDDLTKLGHRLRKTEADSELQKDAPPARAVGTATAPVPRVAVFPNGLALIDPLAPVEDRPPASGIRPAAGAADRPRETRDAGARSRRTREPRDRVVRPDRTGYEQEKPRPRVFDPRQERAPSHDGYAGRPRAAGEDARARPGREREQRNTRDDRARGFARDRAVRDREATRDRAGRSDRAREDMRDRAGRVHETSRPRTIDARQERAQRQDGAGGRPRSAGEDARDRPARTFDARQERNPRHDAAGGRPSSASEHARHRTGREREQMSDRDDRARESTRDRAGVRDRAGRARDEVVGRADVVRDGMRDRAGRAHEDPRARAAGPGSERADRTGQAGGAPGDRARRLAFARAVDGKSAYRRRPQGRASGSAPPSAAVAPPREQGGRTEWKGGKGSSGGSKPDRAPDKVSASRSEPGVPGAKRTTNRKPWEFRQKGSTLRRERRRKIASAQAKGRKKLKKD